MSDKLKKFSRSLQCILFVTGLKFQCRFVVHVVFCECSGIDTLYHFLSKTLALSYIVYIHVAILAGSYCTYGYTCRFSDDMDYRPYM